MNKLLCLMFVLFSLMSHVGYEEKNG